MKYRILLSFVSKISHLLVHKAYIIFNWSKCKSFRINILNWWDLIKINTYFFERLILDFFFKSLILLKFIWFRISQIFDFILDCPSYSSSFVMLLILPFTLVLLRLNQLIILELLHCVHLQFFWSCFSSSLFSMCFN